MRTKRQDGRLSSRMRRKKGSSMSAAALTCADSRWSNSASRARSTCIGYALATRSLPSCVTLATALRASTLLFAFSTNPRRSRSATTRVVLEGDKPAADASPLIESSPTLASESTRSTANSDKVSPSPRTSSSRSRGRAPLRRMSVRHRRSSSSLKSRMPTPYPLLRQANRCPSV